MARLLTEKSLEISCEAIGVVGIRGDIFFANEFRVGRFREIHRIRNQYVALNL